MSCFGNANGLPFGRSPVEHIRHVVSLHDRGVICPAEMWAQVTMALANDDPVSVLGLLPDDVSTLLREIYRERPSLSSDDDLSDLTKILEDWCREM